MASGLRRAQTGVAAFVVSLNWLMLSSRAASLGDIFVISLENQNLTAPDGESSSQLLGNPAAPYLNSLLTPGNPNAALVSYATNYTNSGQGVHPSEPNYIWSEAGTNYNPSTSTTVLSDADPSQVAGNIFTNTPHLTGLMNAQGISWTNYEEDYQVSGHGPLVSASGIYPNGQTNPYNGSDEYNYSAKHNPMAFFSDTATENVEPLSQLSINLANNTVSRYNWITPDEYNDMHSALAGTFTYHGIVYNKSNGEQIALGDNFLSIIIPEIEASQAFKNNGAIIIWNDETEDGDGPDSTIPEIVISPLAVGNAYASSVPMNHSSDLKTMQEIFGLGPYLNNPIPSDEPNATGTGFNTVADSNDLSSLFQPGTIPTSPIPLLGDANKDGVVNDLDLSILMSHYGMTLAGGYSVGDFNNDGVVNADDFALFQLGLYEYDQSAADSLPEPNCALLPLLFLSWSRCIRKRSGRFHGY